VVTAHAGWLEASKHKGWALRLSLAINAIIALALLATLGHPTLGRHCAGWLASPASGWHAERGDAAGLFGWGSSPSAGSLDPAQLLAAQQREDPHPVYARLEKDFVPFQVQPCRPAGLPACLCLPAC